MKKFFILSVFLLALFMLLPLSVLSTNTRTAQTDSQNLQELPKKNTENQTVKIKLTNQNKTVTLSLEDYLFGVVAGEMPALYEPEALKAQAVCAYTFLQWRAKENTDKEYDITDNYKVDQCYITKEECQNRWGSKATEYETKIREAIRAVNGEALTYNGELILSVYHSLSGGSTESAKNVWGKDYPYLQAVSSIGDKLANDYITTYSATADQIKSEFGVTLPSGLKGSFTDFKRTESGYVKSVKIGGKEFNGSDVREALSLKSTNFTVSLKDGIFTFTVYGYGHGVGMSQNGANYMAKQGSDYKEILSHYYKGCKIE